MINLFAFFIRYNIPPMLGKGPKYGIGGASISSFIPKSTNPGPGSYTLNESQTSNLQLERLKLVFDSFLSILTSKQCTAFLETKLFFLI